MEAEATQKRQCRVSLLHSEDHSTLLHDVMGFIHQDRDVLLHSLLDYSGFLRNTPSFFSVVSPKKASRAHLERFHTSDYLDLLEFPINEHNHELLDSYGFVEDCPLPKDRAAQLRLWEYCRFVAGASLQGANLLVNDDSDVAIHWGGGRHHAHASRAAGFCYVNDIVLSIQRLQRRFKRILYLDIDIHHADGVQSAFYESNEVMTISFHRQAPGFFPSSSGFSKEKGKYKTNGMGFNLNVVIPRMCADKDFISLFLDVLNSMTTSYLPEVVVLCVGADGLQGDPIVGREDGWHLSPEGIAECVRLCAERCHSETKCKLLVLGGGGYNPTETARTFLLSTAAACDGARPGLLWNELPKDVPNHKYFPRYGPDFRLVGEHPIVGFYKSSPVMKMLLAEAKASAVYINSMREKHNRAFAVLDLEVSEALGPATKRKGSSRRRRKIR